MKAISFIVPAILMALPCDVQAQGTLGKIAREAFEGVAGKLGLKAVGEGAEAAARNGDDVARFFINKGDDVARSLSKGATGLASGTAGLSARSAGRLAKITGPGGMARSGELAEVIRRYGDPAMDFVWRHKGSLAVGTALAAFLANPEAFINGTETLAVPPLVAIGDVARSIVTFVGWAILILTVAMGVAICTAVRNGTLGKVMGHVIVGAIKK